MYFIYNYKILKYVLTKKAGKTSRYRYLSLIIKYPKRVSKVKKLGTILVRKNEVNKNLKLPPGLDSGGLFLGCIKKNYIS